MFCFLLFKMKDSLVLVEFVLYWLSPLVLVEFVLYWQNLYWYWLSPEILDSELQISNYTLFRRDRNRHGGGFASYILSSLSPSLVPLSSCPAEFLLCFLSFHGRPFTQETSTVPLLQYQTYSVCPPSYLLYLLPLYLTFYQWVTSMLTTHRHPLLSSPFSKTLRTPILSPNLLTSQLTSLPQAPHQPLTLPLFPQS